MGFFLSPPRLSSRVIMNACFYATTTILAVLKNNRQFPNFS
jgi:hypothetical protein